MRIPAKINIGDKIGIISTARKIDLNELSPSIDILKSWGLKIALCRFLFEKEDQFAGSIKQRTVALQKMLDDNSIKAILCARGGYGTVQIIDQINFFKFKKAPKWVIGYSDISVLHSHLNTLRIATLHATMPINFPNNSQKSLNSLSKVLFTGKNNIKTSSHKFNQLGRVKAEIVGGNLSILYSLLGSDSDLDTAGKILFIEDLDEYLYHIDRMMVNLKRNGKFQHLKGMIVGSMISMNDNQIPFGKTANEIILEHIKDYDFPFCFGFPSGHLDDNRSIILGKESILDINQNGVVLSQD